MLLLDMFLIITVHGAWQPYDHLINDVLKLEIWFGHSSFQMTLQNLQ